jgi:DNA mismatch endonuclease (patch repair protein)
MGDVFSKEKRSEVMSKIRSKNTRPEIALRKALHGLGMRYRLHAKDLPGSPDVVLPRYRAVIQVRGCFWHGHHCTDGHIPASRREYWEPKLVRNKRRDIRNDKALRRHGWSVIVVWECQLRNRKALGTQIRRILLICKANLGTTARMKRSK